MAMLKCGKCPLSERAIGTRAGRHMKAAGKKYKLKCSVSGQYVAKSDECGLPVGTLARIIDQLSGALHEALKGR